MQQQSNVKSERVLGIDTVRAFAALSVMFAHLIGPLMPSLIAHFPMMPASIAVYAKYLFTGHPAVIVFFVVSGFCIHSPYTRGKLPVLAFVSARWTRIMIPALFAMAFARLAHVEKYNFVEGYILWSIVCELVYYSLYPLLFLISRWVCWRIMFAVAMAVSMSLALILGSDQYGNAHHYGPWLNWLVALPSWLLGCVLAEQISSGKTAPVSRTTVWAWRAGIAVTASVLYWMTLNTSIGYYLTMNWFALLVYFWLKVEIAGARQYGAGMFERIGRWSFSIYLYHVIIFAVFAMFAHRAGIWLYVIGTPLVLVGCYLAYRIIELPAHRLARHLFKRLQDSPLPFNISRSSSQTG